MTARADRCGDDAEVHVVKVGGQGTRPRSRGGPRVSTLASHDADKFPRAVLGVAPEDGWGSRPDRCLSRKPRWRAQKSLPGSKGPLR